MSDLIYGYDVTANCHPFLPADCENAKIKGRKWYRKAEHR